MATITASQFKDRLVTLLELDKKKDADNILWAIEQVCTEAVKAGNSLVFPFGKLNCIVQPARKARNPRTGEKVSVPAKVNVKFKVSRTFIDANAPSLKSKRGKALLEAAEELKEARDKAKRKRDRAKEKEEASSNVTTKKSNKKTKNTSTKSKRKSRV